MPHAYTEDRLVEQPAIGLFAGLGWATASALEETFGATGTLRRETKGEVVLVSRLCAALERVELASDSANGALSNQPGATPQVTCRKTK